MIIEFVNINLTWMKRIGYYMKVKLMGCGFPKVIRMSMKRLYLIILMLAVGCQQAGINTNNEVFAAGTTGGTSIKAKPDEQLELNKNSLLTDPSEEIRIKAATVMLGSDNPAARNFLHDVLRDGKNSAARIAICKALIKTGLLNKHIKNKNDFIQPLLGVLSTENPEESQLAAEAMLIFEYNDIGESLEVIITDSSKPVKVRVNAINVLKRQPDIQATVRLLRLVDDPEKSISTEAEKALRSLGIPVGESYWERDQIISELKDKGRDEFGRVWVIRQENQMRQLKSEVEFWQKEYLSALDTIYEGISDDAARGKFLKRHLSSSEARIKNWALDKVIKWQFASGGPKLPEELEPILLKLIADADKEVKLKTLGLTILTSMDSAEPLLAQLKIENDDQVKIALLNALGATCSHALLVTPAKISPEIRKQTLEFARSFLSEADTAKARKGAEVLGKLLKPNGLKPEELEVYLGLLVKRYNQLKEKPDSALHRELLSAMAGLCTQSSTRQQVSASRAMAIKLFEPIFVEALSDNTDFVRETAVDGLINIDKVKALERLRSKFFDDPSEDIRKKLIVLAGEVGGKEDLPKLAEKIGSNSESALAWQAMLKILDGMDSAIMKEWVDILTGQGSKIKLSNDQKIAFLKKAEAKANSDAKMLESIVEKLGELYYATSQFEQASEYLNKQYISSSTTGAKNAILPKLLDASLRGSKVDLVVKLVEECLTNGDLGPESTVIRSINSFIDKPSGVNTDTVLAALRGVKFTGARPKWQRWLNGLASRLGKSTEAEKAKEAAKANKA